MMALIMTMKNKPQAVMMSFQKEYAERYDWLVTLFKDWAFTFMSSFLYYQDFDMLDDCLLYTSEIDSSKIILLSTVFYCFHDCFNAINC